MRNSERTSGAYGLAGGALIDAAHDHAHQTAAHAPSHHHQHLTCSFGPLFRELRRALGLTLRQRPRSQARASTSSLRSRRADLRPCRHGLEIVQAVTRLTGLAQIDPQPVLALIHLELSRAHRLIAEAEEATRTVPAVAGATLPTIDHDLDQRRRRRSDDCAQCRPPRQASAAAGPVAGETVRPGRAGRAHSRGMFGGLKSLPGSGRMIALSVLLVAAGGTFAQGSESRPRSRRCRRRSSGCSVGCRGLSHLAVRADEGWAPMDQRRGPAHPAGRQVKVKPSV